MCLNTTSTQLCITVVCQTYSNFAALILKLILVEYVFILKVIDKTCTTHFTCCICKYIKNAVPISPTYIYLSDRHDNLAKIYKQNNKCCKLFYTIQRIWQQIQEVLDFQQCFTYINVYRWSCIHHRHLVMPPISL